MTNDQRLLSLIQHVAYKWEDSANADDGDQHLSDSQAAMESIIEILNGNEKHAVTHGFLPAP